MSERSGIFNLLQRPWVYALWQWLTGAPAAHRRLVRELDLQPGDSILDIGSGDSALLDYLPDFVCYQGIEPNPSYVEKARSRARKQDLIWQAKIDAELGLVLPDGIAPYNIVLALRLFHHLDDHEAMVLWKTLHDLLVRVDQANYARCVVNDNCLADGYPLAAWVIRHDRGAHPRPYSWYEISAKQYFGRVECTFGSLKFPIPATGVQIVCCL